MSREIKLLPKARWNILEQCSSELLPSSVLSPILPRAQHYRYTVPSTQAISFLFLIFPTIGSGHRFHWQVMACKDGVSSDLLMMTQDWTAGLLQAASVLLPAVMIP